MRAVNYYQGFKIVHRFYINFILIRDLKPENFLFQKKNDMASLIVIDFGIAKRGVDKLKTKMSFQRHHAIICVLIYGQK